MELPDKSKQEPPKKKVVVPVVASSKEVKRPATRRFFDFIFAESPKEIMKRVAHDVLVPRAKAGVEEAFQNFLGGMLWGSPGNRPLPNGVVRGTVIRGGSVNYAAISNSQNPSMLYAQQASQGNQSGYRDLVYRTQQEAEIVLASMYDLLNEYRVVAVGDLYELSNQPSSPATQISDNNQGWTSLDGARISRVASGFVLELPRPTFI